VSYFKNRFRGPIAKQLALSWQWATNCILWPHISKTKTSINFKIGASQTRVMWPNYGENRSNIKVTRAHNKYTAKLCLNSVSGCPINFILEG